MFQFEFVRTYKQSFEVNFFKIQLPYITWKYYSVRLRKH